MFAKVFYDRYHRTSKAESKQYKTPFYIIFLDYKSPVCNINKTRKNKEGILMVEFGIPYKKKLFIISKKKSCMHEAMYKHKFYNGKFHMTAEFTAAETAD